MMMLTFGLMVVLLFGLAMGAGGRYLSKVFPGILWMTFLFAGMLGIGRSYSRELAEEALTGLELAPGGRLAIFVSKLLTGFTFMFGLELLTTPVFFALLNEPWHGSLTLFVFVLALGALGFVGIGTLFSAISSHLRSGDVMLPMLMIPLELPVILTTVQATRQILAPGHASPDLWIKGLVAYDVIFLALPLLMYDYIWEV